MWGRKKRNKVRCGAIGLNEVETYLQRYNFCEGGRIVVFSDKTDATFYRSVVSNCCVKGGL